MKKAFILLVTALLGLHVSAQENTTDEGLTADTALLTPHSPILIGYLSYDTALRAMPQLAIVQKNMDELRQQYDDEMKRVEDEFNQKYEAFLEGQKDFPRTILLKRQQELQELLQQNVDFKNKSRQELQQAEQEALAPLRARLNEAIATIARERGLALVINIDTYANGQLQAPTVPFIEPLLSTDITAAVIAEIGQ